MPSRADLAKIHIAKKELGLTDEAYRDILRLHFQVESARDLTPRQATVLLNKFRAKGWKPKKSTRPGSGNKDRKNRNYRHIKPGPAAAQQRYVLSLWNRLGYDIRKLDARCRRQFGIERIEWVTDHHQLHVLITDLEHRCQAASSREQKQRTGK